METITITTFGQTRVVKLEGPLSNIAKAFLGAYGSYNTSFANFYLNSSWAHKLVKACMKNYKLRKQVYARVEKTTGLNIDDWYYANQTM